MKKIILIITLFLFNQLLIGQEFLGSFNNTLKNSTSSIKDVIPIVNKKNGDIAFFMADAKNVYGYKLDNQFNLQGELSSPEKRRKYKILIGSSISNDDNYRVFLTNKGYNKFSFVNFSFANKQSSFNEFELENSNEKFIQTVRYNNEFYLITAAKLSNYNRSIKGLFIYTFDQSGKPIRREIDTKTLTFLDKDGNMASVPSLVIKFSDHITKIEDNVPSSIEVAADLKKMYQRNNMIIFTFDDNKEFTQVLKINLDNYKASNVSFKKPMSETDISRKKTNSYLNGDKLFTLAAHKESFEMHVNNFEDRTKIKEFKFSKDDPITFKNTPIIQEGGMYDNYRELESAKKFLRKITADKIGVSSIKLGNNYHVTIGGYVLQQRGGMMMPMGFGGIPIATMGSVNIFFNPVHFAYNSMSNTKSTRVECLFDENFNHLKGEIEENAFDKINEYQGESSEGETIFKYDGYYILGTYDTYSKKYTLKKFIE